MSSPAQPTWADVEATLPDHLPDAARDSVRDSFFYQHVAPQMAQKGVNIEDARQEFRKQTERPDKAPYPRLEQTGMSALHGLAAPLAGAYGKMTGDQGPSQALEEMEAGQEQETARQGISPTPYKMAGEMIGQAPYWAVGMGAAGKAAEAVKAVRGLKAAIHTIAGGLVQGSYDAASADGDPIIAGLKGAAWGAGTVGAFESAGPLWRFLKGAHPEISSQAAKSVEDLTLGKYSEEIAQTASEAIGGTDHIEDSVAEWKAANVKAAKQNGVPKAATVNNDLKGKVQLQVQGADGKPYTLTGLPEEVIKSPNLTEHLDAGGSIQDIGGDPVAASKFLLLNEKLRADNLDLEVPIGRPDNPGEWLDEFVGPLGKRKVGTTKLTNSEVRRSTGLPGKPSVDELINARNSYYHATDLEGMRGILGRGEINTSSSHPVDEEGWMESDHGEGDVTSGVSVSRVPRFLSKADKPITFVIDAEKMPSSRPYTELDYRKTNVDPYLAAKMHKEDPEQTVEEWQKIRPDIAQRNPQFEYEQRTYNEPIPVSAVKGILVDRKALSGVKFADSEHQTYGSWLTAGDEGKVESVQQIMELAQQHNIPVKVFQSGEELHNYRAGLAKEPPGRRWGVSMKDIPPLDNPTMTEMAEPRAETQNVERVRGSADPPLNENGHQQAQEVGERLQAKGGLDDMVSSSSVRAMQSAGHVLQANPRANFAGVADELQSMRSGHLEGSADMENAHKVKASLWREAPDTAIPGRSPASGLPGESPNQVRERVLNAVQQLKRDYEANPRKIGVMTHFTPINLVDAWAAKGTPEDLSIDVEDYLRHKEDPSQVYRFAPNKEGDWKLRKVDLDNDQELRNGIYFIRHGETDWNPPAVKYKETPLVHRYQGDSEVLGGNLGAEIGHEGEKPSVYLNADADRQTLSHEMFHGTVSATGLRKDINELMHDPIVYDIMEGAFDPESKSLYLKAPQVLPEEVYAFASSAVRTGNQDTLEAFGNADTDKETVINWTVDKSKDLLDRLSQVPDSLHKRSLERRTNAVIARGSRYLDDIQSQYNHTGVEVTYNGRDWSATLAENRLRFNDREALLNHLEENYQAPLLAPELVDTTPLPDGIPRYASRLGTVDNQKPPLSSSPSSLKGEPTRKGPGSLIFSHFFRPPSGWYDSAARRFDMPELFQAWQNLDDSQLKLTNAAKPYEEALGQLGEGLADGRHNDLFKYFSANEEDAASIAKELKFSPEEMEKIQHFDANFAKPLDLRSYLQDYLPALKAGADPEQVLESGSAIYDAVQRGDLDPRDSDIIRISNNYMRGILTHDIIKPATNSLADLAKSADLRELRPLIERDIDYALGRPDITTTAVRGAVESFIELGNKAITNVNKFLPSGMHIESLEDNPRDAIDKYLLLSYAGSLALRPAILIRNLAELFTTSYPILGNHLWGGLRDAFPALREGQSNELVERAYKYGAMVSKSNLQELYAGGGPAGGVEGKLEKIGIAALRYLQVSHNATRLVAFAGFEKKVGEAIRANLQDPKAFLRESGLWFLPKGQQDVFTREFSKLTPETYDDFASRAASKLVDATQWNYRRGATPGLYKYQLGRLFGQYGTWPLNYLEYARRFAQASDKQAMVQGLTRLAIAHSTILFAGQGAGIDTSHWVFFSPAGYEGSPLLKAVLSAPAALSSGPRGEEARSNLLDVANPMELIPGAEEFKEMYSAVNMEDRSKLVRLMGFTPYEGGK